MNLQKAPLGLLELFRLKSAGQNPNQFADFVQPCVDVAGFYGADTIQNTLTSGAAGAISAGLTATATSVARRYLSLSGLVVVGAAPGTYLTLAIGFNFAGGSVVPLQSQTFTAVAGGVYRVTAFVGGLVLPAGISPALVVNGDAGGADHTPGILQSFQNLDGA